MRYLVSIFVCFVFVFIQFCFFRPQKSLLLMKVVVKFEGFAVLTYVVVLMMFLWALGPSWGPLKPLLGGPWRSAGAFWGRLGGDLVKAPKIFLRAPKTLHGGLPDAP